MKKIIVFYIIIVMQLFCKGFILEKDGEKIVLENIPEKIATDSAIVSRILDTLEIELVGVPTSMTKIPKRYDKSSKIGRAGSPDYEKIKSLDVDLLISSTFSKFSSEKRYKELDIPVFYLDLETYQTSLESLKLLGKAFNKIEISEKILANIRKREERIVEKAKKQSPKRIAVLYNLDDTLSIISNKHYMNELITKINCVNVSDEVKGKINTRAQIITISAEDLVLLNPDYILRISPNNYEDKLLKEESLLKVTNAYKNKRILSIDPTLFRMSSGINGIDALEELYKVIYEN